MKAKLELDNKDFNSKLNQSVKTANSAGTKIAKGLETAGNSLKDLSNGSKGIGNIFSAMLGKIGPWGLAVTGIFAGVTAAVTGIIKGVNALTGKLDGIAKGAKSVNMDANAYISLQHAANRTGVEMDKLLTIINKLDYAVVKSIDGDKKLRDAFLDIGLTWELMQSYSPEKRIMALTEAVSKLKEAGKDVPASLYDIIGRKDMQTMNKLVNDGGFNKYIAEANALGYGINPQMIQIAEAYGDSVSDVNQKLLAMVSNWKAIKDVSKGLREMVEDFSNSLPANGKVAEEFADQFEGIGNVADKLFAEKNSDFIQALKTSLMNEHVFINDEQRNRFSAWLDDTLSKINSIDELIQKFDVDASKNAFEAVSEVDSRFDVKDKSTWVQAIDDASMLATDEEKAASAANTLVDELIKQSNLIDNQISSMNKTLNIQKEIENIESKFGVKLNEELQTRIKIADAAQKEKHILLETAKIKDKSTGIINSAYADILTNNRTGINKEVLDTLFNAQTSITGQSQLEQIIGSLNFQIEKRDYMKNNHIQEYNLLPKDYNKIMETTQSKIANGTAKIKDLQEYINTYPNMLLELTKGIAEDFINGNLFSVPPQKMKEINKFFNDAISEGLYADSVMYKEFDWKDTRVSNTAKLFDMLKENHDKFLGSIEKEVQALEEAGNNPERVKKLKALTEDYQKFETALSASKMGVAALNYNRQLNSEKYVLGQQNVKKSQFDELIGLQDRMKTMIGKGLEASIGQALRAAKEAKGGFNLNPDEAAMATEIAKTKYFLDNFQMPQLQDAKIYTNELASRGGFASSVRVERKDNTMDILNTCRMLNSRVEMISNYAKMIGGKL